MVVWWSESQNECGQDLDGVGGMDKGLSAVEQDACFGRGGGGLVGTGMSLS